MKLEKIAGTALGVLVLVLGLAWGVWRIYSVFFWSGPKGAGASCSFNAGCKSSWCSRTAEVKPGAFADQGRKYCARGCRRDDQCGAPDLGCRSVSGKQRCVRVQPAAGAP